jgi:hypothetical protein
VEGRLLIGKAFLKIPARPSYSEWSRVIANLEVAKDRYGVPYILKVDYFPFSWIYSEVSLSGINDWPTQPDGEDYTKWNTFLFLTSEGSNTIVRTDTRKSWILGLGYGRVFQGRNSGVGSEVVVSLAFSF